MAAEEAPMERASVLIFAAALAAAGSGFAGAGAPHPDLTIPQPATPAVRPDEPTELEPIVVTGKTNPMDLGINRARLLVDLSCKLCKDADFSVKGAPPDR